MSPWGPEAAGLLWPHVVGQASATACAARVRSRVGLLGCLPITFAALLLLSSATPFVQSPTGLLLAVPRAGVGAAVPQLRVATTTGQLPLGSPRRVRGSPVNAMRELQRRQVAVRPNMGWLSGLGVSCFASAACLFAVFGLKWRCRATGSNPKVMAMASTSGEVVPGAGTMAARTVTTVAGLTMPAMLYGTAWKKERTSDLVVQAVRAGFRGIDTACQPKHYREDLVGEALLRLEKEGVPRSSLFIQTKFTSVRGQDPNNVPYDPHLPLPEQVRQSVAVSLRQLHSAYIDSLVLHSPMPTHEQTMAVWRTLEDFHAQGVVRQLGISNVSFQELTLLLRDAQVPPAVVQNRFYADTDFDRPMRELLRGRGIWYQSFWTLTANPNLLRHPQFQQIAAARGLTPAQLLFKFLTQSGVVPLTGTTSELHMAQDLAVLDAPPLPAEDLQRIDALLT
eukprot:EG_transcript_10034